MNTYESLGLKSMKDYHNEIRKCQKLKQDLNLISKVNDNSVDLSKNYSNIRMKEM